MIKGKMAPREQVRMAAQNSGKYTKNPNVIPLKLDKPMEYFVPEKKSYNLIIVPYVVSDLKHPENVGEGYYWPRRNIHVHPNMGMKKENIVCLKSIGQTCPICEHYWNLIKSGVNKNDRGVSVYKNRARTLCHVIDVDKDPKKVMLFDFSYASFTKLLDERVVARQGKDEYEFYFDPDEGSIIEVDFIEKEFNGSKYLEASGFVCTKRKPLPQEVMEQIIDIDGASILKTHKELKDIIYEIQEDQNQHEAGTDPFAPEKEETPTARSTPINAYEVKSEDETKATFPSEASDMDDFPY